MKKTFQTKITVKPLQQLTEKFTTSASNEESFDRRNISHSLPFKCAVCKATFKLNDTLKQHFISVHDRHRIAFECYKCKLLFGTDKDLQDHLKIFKHHSKIETVISAYEHNSTTNLSFAAKQNSDNIVCSWKNCGEKFNHPRELRSHKKIHKLENPIKCLSCNKHFRLHRDLNRHSYMHRRSKTKTFTTISETTKTILNVCTWKNCTKSFDTESLLNDHMVIHKREKLYKCSVCEKRYNCMKTAKEHMSVHKSNVSFKCHKCPVLFNSNKDFQNHIQVHEQQNKIKNIEEPPSIGDPYQEYAGGICKEELILFD